FRPTYNFYKPLPPPPIPLPLPLPPPQLPPPSPSPTRTLLLSSVPSHVTESVVRRDMEPFGDVRAVQMEKVRDGGNYLSVPVPPPAPGLIDGCAVWAQFTFPVAGELPDGYNQGTLVVFNLNSDVTTRTLKETFGAFGFVKELRGTSLEKNQKFVEFYDTRDAAKALKGINGKEIKGKIVVVEFSRGGNKNSPKQHRLNPISSIGPPSVIFTRKFPLESRPYHPPPPPPSHPLRKTGTKQLQQGGGGAWSKQRKGLRQARNKYDPRFIIKEDGIIDSEPSVLDSRTTIMIKNIPNKYRCNSETVAEHAR
ncbi:hypothetical protein M8C21_032804, partial [Ambrosia artemisiifolia]